MSRNVMTEVKCSDCGKTTQVPFKPSAGKPVYCRECLSKHRSSKKSLSKAKNAGNEKQAWSRRRMGWKSASEKSVPV